MKETELNQPVVYTVFHLNMAFSSIEESDRPDVIKRCYWPLLELARSGFRIGIEATSYTLRTIQTIDPSWTACLRQCIEGDQIEFVGSGYVQMIAPLVPSNITRKNLAFGLMDYQEILGIAPEVYLFNEQAYAPGILPFYTEIGARAVIMDSSETASRSPQWNKEYSRKPQYIEGANGTKLPVIWSDAISFQKFQRYAHNEIDADEYFEFLSLQLGRGVRAFPLYTSDAEVFDYRPGRFNSEANIGVVPEYERVGLLFQALANSKQVVIGTPSDALNMISTDATAIKLETAQAPIPVKKQRKYNVLRWAVTGRNDLVLNTHCWRLNEAFIVNGADDKDWRTLCLLWSSDWRTHITEKRWQSIQAMLEQNQVVAPVSVTDIACDEADVPAGVTVRREGRFLVIEAGSFHLALNCGRGLAIQSFGFGAYQPASAGAPAKNGLVGTLAHGFYDDIAYGADFYSGHYVCEPAAQAKSTDLVSCEPEISFDKNNHIMIVGQVADITKTLVIDTRNPHITVNYSANVLPQNHGTFRCGHIKLNPRAFNRETLYYSSKNGGEQHERHSLFANGHLIEVDHGVPVSRLVSATNGLGMTSGVLEIGDDTHFIKLAMKRSHAASVGLVTAQTVAESFFVRACLTLAETDDTYRDKTLSGLTAVELPIVEYSITLGKQGSQAGSEE
ncbi:hypothetical protein [Kordiimonas aquimaris]|uniref:hypothetical protein n=1 Tax=Kordiimonas aquimaris TaxID=707591 RepID=UPI0021D0A64C|nr:hypothetical protein [Kordiimonas aquimaris]